MLHFLQVLCIIGIVFFVIALILTIVSHFINKR